MTISTGDILGNSQVGVYLSVIGNNLFYPTSLDKPAIEEIEQAFDLEMNPILIGGSSLLGSLIVGNKQRNRCSRYCNRRRSRYSVKFWRDCNIRKWSKCCRESC